MDRRFVRDGVYVNLKATTNKSMLLKKTTRGGHSQLCSIYAYLQVVIGVFDGLKKIRERKECLERQTDNYFGHNYYFGCKYNID